MKHLSAIACAALLAGGLAFPAFAASADANQNMTGATSNARSASANTSSASQNAPGQNNSATGSMGMNGANSPSNMHIAQKMRTDLSKAGFTDIHIMPSSFLVRAKDSSGNPVMMVINPDSVTEITEQNASNAAHKGANAAGTNTTGGQPSATPGASQTKP